MCIRFLLYLIQFCLLSSVGGCNHSGRRWLLNGLLRGHHQHEHEPLPPLVPRMPTNVTSCLPGFLAIGTQKGGTSSLYHFIRGNVHPGLWSTKDVKEQDFFNRHIERGTTLQEYLHRFPFVAERDDPVAGTCSALDAALKAQESSNAEVADGTPRPPPSAPAAGERSAYHGPFVWGEVSPNYLPTWRAPPRAAEALPDARIVVLLKHPARRFISAFNMLWQWRLCQDMAWQVSDCFRGVNASREELVRDYVGGIHAEIAEQAAAERRCHVALLRGDSSDGNSSSGGSGEAPPVAPHDIMPLCWERGLSLPRAPGRQTLGQALAGSRYHDPATGALSSEGLEAVLEANATLWRGVYADQLPHWFAAYPARNFLIWSSEDFAVEPAAHMRQLAGWLGLDPALVDEAAVEGRHHQRDKLVSAPPEVRRALLEFYRPHNTRLYALLRGKGFGALADRLQARWDEWGPDGSH